jgi:hypothetical protein
MSDEGVLGYVGLFLPKYKKLLRNLPRAVVGRRANSIFKQ